MMAGVRELYLIADVRSELNDLRTTLARMRDLELSLHHKAWSILCDDVTDALDRFNRALDAQVS
jgi:hypothetical protein